MTTPWWTNETTYIATTGQVKSLTRGAQKLEWEYDGFLLTKETATGLAPATSTYSYDSDFRVVSHSLGGAAVAFQYDADGLLTLAGPVSLSRRAASGRLDTATVGTIATGFTYSPYGEVASLAVAGLYSEGLQYDDAGRLVVVEETVQGTPSQWTYSYDAMGRLTSAALNGGTSHSWTYDGNGNRLSEDGVASSYDAQDRLLSRGTTSYGWDALGGRSTKTEGSAVTHFVHDGLGALQSVTLPSTTVISYDYDARQRRIGKRVNGSVTKRWVYDGQYRVVAEVDASGTVESRFIYGSQSHSPDALVRGGNTYAYVKNHLGSVRLVVDAASGTVMQRLDYDAWGNVVGDSNPGFQPFGFAGGVYDSDTHLTHFGFRDYDAQAGAWTSKDPIRLEGGPNAYEYAVASPTLRTDKTGMDPVADAVGWLLVIPALFSPDSKITIAGDPSSWGNNWSVWVEGHPWWGGGGTTIGHVTCAAKGFSAKRYWQHERQHVTQGMFMPAGFYLLLHGTAMGWSILRSYVENGKIDRWQDYDRYNWLETGPYGRDYTGQGHQGDDHSPARPWP